MCDEQNYLRHIGHIGKFFQNLYHHHIFLDTGYIIYFQTLQNSIIKN